MKTKTRNVDCGKKAQVKIQQMAFMLMAITLFFVFVGLFLFSAKFSDVKKTAESLQEENALLLVSKLASSPELSCGEAYGGQRTNCVDADKLMALSLDNERYSRFWGIKSLEVRKIYPNDFSDVECSTSNYPECGFFKIISTEFSSGDKSAFVSLCRKDYSREGYDKCELAKIFVGF